MMTIKMDKIINSQVSKFTMYNSIQHLFIIYYSMGNCLLLNYFSHSFCLFIEKNFSIRPKNESHSF